VIGSFYNRDGDPTPSLLSAEAAHAKLSAAAKADAELGSSQVHCNTKWTKEGGGWVWCTGSKYPRRVMMPDLKGELHERCVCFDEPDINKARKGYQGCKKDANRCLSEHPDPEWDHE
jgi:hypothetical protein